jgi:peptidoglycan hydrolase CwlO-like protein
MNEMGNTLSKMHALLKQMQAKTVASGPKDPIAKANLEMWGLMLGDLDKQYEQLRIATHAREDLEARRAAMYKQADAKAAAEQRRKVAGAAQAAGGVDSPRVAPAAASPAPAQPAAAAPATPQLPPSSSPN